MPVKIGVLALQGAFARHAEVLDALGARPAEVRTAAHLDDVEALVLPGGESTTMSMLLESSGLFDPIAERLAGGMAAFGTCAGMILLGAEIVGGRPDQRCFGALDVSVRRNAFGRQVDSFETDLAVAGLDGLDDADGRAGRPFHATFIRAPFVERVGPEVEVLAQIDDHPVLCRQGAVLAAAFHPELGDDARLHELFIRQVRDR